MSLRTCNYCGAGPGTGTTMIQHAEWCQAPKLTPMVMSDSSMPPNLTYRPSTCSQSQKELERSAWLVEQNDCGRLWYLAARHERGGCRFHWVHDPEKALQLSRREDAEAILVMASHIGRAEFAKATEHLFYEVPA